MDILSAAIAKVQEFNATYGVTDYDLQLRAEVEKEFAGEYPAPLFMIKVHDVVTQVALNTFVKEFGEGLKSIGVTYSWVYNGELYTPLCECLLLLHIDEPARVIEWLYEQESDLQAGALESIASIVHHTLYDHRVTLDQSPRLHEAHCKLFLARREFLETFQKFSHPAVERLSLINELSVPNDWMSAAALTGLCYNASWERYNYFLHDNGVPLANKCRMLTKALDAKAFTKSARGWDKALIKQQVKSALAVLAAPKGDKGGSVCNVSIGYLKRLLRRVK